MNDAVPVSSDGFLTTAGLAARPDFTLGLAIISPSTRTIAGPGGTADVEPRVMQVLVVLADAAGQVVTRDTLFQRCWGGVFVGDDSLNRAIGAVRKLAGEIAGGTFEIETIPRTGYRLVGARAELDGGSVAGISLKRKLSRRQALGAGIVGLAATSGAGIWWTLRERSGARFDALIRNAETAIRKDSADGRTIAALEEAVANRPDNPRALGLLALAYSILAPVADPKDTSRMIGQAETAARRALALNPREPYALLAMFELQGSTLDWAARDRRLRQIIAIDPSNLPAISELVLLLQAAGLNRESWNWNERAIALEPFSLNYLSKRALKLWIAGRVPDADKVIDQVRALYPADPWAWWVRFLIYALTDRPEAAQAMLASHPRMLPDPVEANVWRTALAALLRPSAAAVARAHQVCFDAARIADQTTGQGVMILSALGDVDGAFAIANGSLLSRGPIVREEKPSSKAPLENAIARVNMQWLFTPPCAAMRADQRFLPLCEGIGLTQYWAKRGIKPDYQLGIT